MKIELERGDVSFSTLAGPYGRMRACVVKIGGKQFFATRTVETWMEMADEGVAAEMDRILVRSFEHMLTDIFEKACVAIPEGLAFGDALFYVKAAEKQGPLVGSKAGVPNAGV